MITADAFPHNDVTVGLTIASYDASGADDYDPSAGLIPDDTTVTLTLENKIGVLGFSCADGATGTELVYTLSGTDASSF